jgi:GTPase SAR1 family protein
MGSNQSKILAHPNSSSPLISPINTERTRRTVPDLQFRVLIIGRANAGKTSILQRVCETTESPKIYQGGTRKKVRHGGPNFDPEV